VEFVLLKNIISQQNFNKNSNKIKGTKIMLEQIFSADRLDKISGKELKQSKKDTGSQNAEDFEQLLAQEQKNQKSEKLDHKGILNNLASMFEDDKEFFKETFNFLNASGELESESGDTELANLKTPQSSSSLVSETVTFAGLNFGGNLKVSDLDDSKLKILIHQAKEVLKEELMKHSFSESDLKNRSLRDLSSLAGRYGLNLKDVKISGSGGQSELTENLASNSVSNRVTQSQSSSSGSTQNLMNLRNGFEVRTPAQFLQSVNSAENSGINMAKNNSKEVDLNTLLAQTNVTKNKETETKTINLSSLLNETEVDTSKLSSEAQKIDKAIKFDAVANAKMGTNSVLTTVEENQIDSSQAITNAKRDEMVNNISKKLGMSAELLKSVFSDQELKEMNMELNPNNLTLNSLNTAVTELSVANSENISTSSNSATVAVNEDLGVTKADISANKVELEQKIELSKQSMKYLSDDIKRAIEDYRPPFQKLTLNLNPKNLGEIDVTLVQRGNNMHINLSGNATAINLLASNSTELKNSLIDAGLDNPNMNFSDNSDSSNGSKNSRREEEIEKMLKNSNEDLETEAEEFSNSLEIVTNYS
jgi:hypothetical protein